MTGQSTSTATEEAKNSGFFHDGIDEALTLLCKYLGVDPGSVSWDAATETVEGDVSSVIGNILHAKFGEDWGPNDAAQGQSGRGDYDHGYADGIEWATKQGEPQTLPGMIAAVYGSLDAEDCAKVDRQWAKQRGYILPADGTSALAYAETKRDIFREALIRISDSDWFWKGDGSDTRMRGSEGKIAASALGIPLELPLGWSPHNKSETELALAKASSVSSTHQSSPAATIGDIPSEPRPPASAAMGLSAGGVTEIAAAKAFLREKPSTSYLQRKMQITYNHALRLITALENEGFISIPDSQGRRTILLTSTHHQDAAK